MSAPASERIGAGGMDRRRFLKQLEVLSGGALCAALPGVLSACGGARGARYLDAALLDEQVVVQRVDVEEGGGALVEVPGSDLPVYLHSDGAGGYSAVSTRCMHQGCQVEPAADRLACPCHGSEYTFTGEVLRGPTERPLLRYQVTADAMHVYIHLPPAGSAGSS
jgi:cytochrome b6-f complex iron-sulfur subunit